MKITRHHLLRANEYTRIYMLYVQLTPIFQLVGYFQDTKKSDSIIMFKHYHNVHKSYHSQEAKIIIQTRMSNWDSETDVYWGIYILNRLIKDLNVLLNRLQRNVRLYKQPICTENIIDVQIALRNISI